MMKMPGIVVGVDGSEHSRKALAWAVHEAGIRRAPLTIVSVQPSVAGIFSPAVAYPGDEALTEQARQAALKETEDALGDVSDASRPASVSVRAVLGIPAEALVDASADADMIVVGSRGAGGFSKLLLGSVSTQVVHHAHCPVVVLR